MLEFLDMLYIVQLNKCGNTLEVAFTKLVSIMYQNIRRLNLCLVSWWSQV